MITSAVTERLGIRHPILLAPMAGVAGASLANAVSRAGGFGIVGGGYGDRPWLEAQLTASDCASIGVGFITWRLLQQPDLLTVALDYAPQAIFLSFGDLGRFAPVISASKSLFIAQIQSLEDAKIAVDLGADMLVAQGTEAGGHGGHRATMPLVPAVVDAVGPIPVIAAGGIADGRGLAAALMLGASGALMGTRFYCCEESSAADAAKARAIAASGDETIRSRVFDVLRGYSWPNPYTLRTIRNDMTEQFADNIEQLRSDEHAQATRFADGLASGNYDVAAVIAGEALDLVNDLPRAGDIVQAVSAQAIACLQHPAHFSVQP
ncbi:MAG: nitronate monooxygenase [Proteobacteria bacterium]|nr:nitronate monooxygenase [Pseudomonadota bacterium]